MVKRIIAGDLRTGLIRVRAAPAHDGFATEILNGAGEIDVSIRLPMRDPLTGTKTDLLGLIEPVRSFIGLEEDGEIVEAGPLWVDDFSFDTNVLQWKGAGLWSYWDYRFLLPLLGPLQTQRDVASSWSGLSLRTIAKRYVQTAQLITGGSVPVVLEADIAGTHERNHPGGDLLTVSQALENISGVDGGPDIAFRPRYKPSAPNYVEWVMKTGDPLLTSAKPHIWDMAAPGRTVRGTRMKRDGTRLVSRMFERGASVRNRFNNGDAGDDLDGFSAVGVTMARSTAWTADGGRAAVQLTGNGAADSYVAIGGDSGAVRLGFEAGKTYTVTATGRVATALSGTAVGGARERTVCVHTRVGTAAYVVATSAAIPNTAGSVARVSVTFTMPANPSEAFVRLYLGRTAGVIQWTAVMVTDGVIAHKFAVDALTVEAVADDDTLVVAGFPVMEDSEGRSSVVDPATLKSYAIAGVEAGRHPVETLTFSAVGERTPKSRDVHPGDIASISFPEDNERLPKGKHPFRVMTKKVSLGSAYVEYTCLPQRAGAYPRTPVADLDWYGDMLDRLRRQADEDRRRT